MSNKELNEYFMKPISCSNEQGGIDKKHLIATYATANDSLSILDIMNGLLYFNPNNNTLNSKFFLYNYGSVSCFNLNNINTKQREEEALLIYDPERMENVLKKLIYQEHEFKTISNSFMVDNPTINSVIKNYYIIPYNIRIIANLTRSKQINHQYNYSVITIHFYFDMALKFWTSHKDLNYLKLSTDFMNYFDRCKIPDSETTIEQVTDINKRFL